MLPDQFQTAMFNRLGLGPYHAPGTVQNRGFEWLVVERDGTVLQISDGTVAADPDDVSAGEPAPEGLAPNNTIVGLYAATEPESGADVFLLVRHLPNGLRTSGRFFPADGYARVTENGHGLHLEAHGRHFHSVETRNGGVAFIDAGTPAPQLGAGRNWHFDAEQRPTANGGA